MNSIPAFAFIAAACLAAAFLGARVTAPEVPTWYAGLKKPSWTPPRLAFPIVWPVLYVMIAIAGWRIWEVPSSELRTWCLIAYSVQLALNAAWSPVFFGGHKVFGGLVTILALDIVLSATIVAAWQLDRPAAFLLMPYLLWTLFATALNASIWKRN